MPVFTYKAFGADGRAVNGSLTSDTPATGRDILRQQGLHLVEFVTVEAAGDVSRGLGLRQRRRQDQASEFARQLSLLLRTGVSLVEALDVLIAQQSGRLVTILRNVRDRVAAGSTLSNALETHPSWFDDVFCSAVRVGQLSGHLDASLQELSVYIRERQTTRTKLLTALAYPIILAILGTAVSIFLMSYVVPQLLTVLEASGRPLPTATVVLKRLSDFLTGHWTAIASAALCMGFAGHLLNRWEPGRRWVHSLLLRLPLAGGLVRKAVIAQFAQVMSLLLRSGVPFLEALRLVRHTAQNLILSDELQRMESAIQRGSDIGPTMQNSRIFPPLVVHIVNVGQRSGELTEMLAQLKEGYETEVRLAIARFTAVVEPALIVVMSVVVGFIVFATMMPILEATRLIN